MTRQETAALALVLMGSTLFVAHKFENGFVYDDVFVVEASLIHDPSRIGEVFATHTMVAQGDSPNTPMDTYRPLTLLTFFWDAWMSGREAWSYHLTNHLLHLAVVSCLFALARILLPAASVWIIALVALFFGISPQLAEGHVWINGRSDPLATLFGLLSLLVWHRADGKQASAASWLGATALFFAGLLCKEVLLFAIPSLLVWPSRESIPLRRRIVSLTPFAIAGAAYMMLRSWALQGLRASHGAEQAARALKNLPLLWMDGLRELVAPSRLYLRSMRDEYGAVSENQRLLILSALVIAAALVWLSRKRAPVFAWGMTWFVCTLAPASMVSALLWLGFGRYLYMPCAGLALGLGELTALTASFMGARFARDESRARWARRIGLFVVSSYLLSLGAGLVVITKDYSNNKSLYSAAALASPTPAYAYAWLGTSMQRTEPERAIPLHEKAVALDPSEPRYLHDLVVSYLLSGNPQLAEQKARDGIARAPADRVGDLRSLLIQTLAGGNPRAAVLELCECLRFQPDYPGCLAAPGWMLDPRGPRASDFRRELASFDSRCDSLQARIIVAKLLAVPQTSAATLRP